MFVPNTVASQVSKYMGNAVTVSNMWGGIIVNVKASPYNAKGDGVTNDTVAIQAAINYAISIGKKEITFPAGTYIYGVLTNTSGLTFIGDGVTLTGTTLLTITSFASHLASYAKEVARVFNVKGYGALVDGSTDDTTAVNATIAAAVANGGGIVYFPPGICVIASTLTTITTSGVILKGAGRESSLIRFTSLTANFLTFGNLAGSTVIGCGISDLSIYHLPTRSAGMTLTFLNAQQYTVSNLSFYNAFHFIKLGDTTDTTSGVAILKNIVGGCLGASLAIDISGMNGVYMENCQINGVTAAGGTAIRLPLTGFGLDTLIMDNCLFQRFGYGMLVQPSATTVQNVYITNTFFDAIDTYGLNIQPTSTGVVTRFEFLNCWFTSANEDCVVLGGSGSSKVDGVYFTKCRMLLAGKRGVFIASTIPINWSLIECKISGCSALVSNTLDGVYISAGATKFRIINCVIGDEGQTTPKQRFGITLMGNCDLYLIEGNQLLGNLTAGIFDSVGTFTKKLITNNIGYNPLGLVTAPAVPASTVAQANNFSSQVQVFIYGGTVTGIAKNGTGIGGMTNGSIILYPGETITITYSVVPTWTWFAL